MIYRVTKEGINTLRSFYPERKFRQRPANLNFAGLYHDLLLTDVIRKLKSGFRGYSIYNTKASPKDFEDKVKLPDAVMINESTGKKIAIELELTIKSERRYREIVSTYRLEPEFEKVIYIVSGEQMRKKIGGIVTGFGSRFKEKDNTGRFYFTDLKTLLDQEINQLSFSNGAEAFLPEIESSLTEQNNDLTYKGGDLSYGL